MRENLAKLAFGDLVDGDHDLYKALQAASLSRDEGAPLYVSQKDMDTFNNRRDIRDLRVQYTDAVAVSSSSGAEPKRICSRISWILDCLCDLKVAELRKAYFKDVDKLRSLGQSTVEIRDAAIARNPRRSHHASTGRLAEAIWGLLEMSGDLKGGHKEVSDPLLGQILAEYLAGKVVPVPVLGPNTAAAGFRIEQKDTRSSKSQCLLCGTPLADRSKLTRHVKARHRLDEPFNCPECSRQGKKILVPTGGPAWAAHAERVHGKSNTPVLRNMSEGSAKKMPCPLCGKPFLLGTALSLHLSKHHKPRGHFEYPTPCAICGTEILGDDAWTLHISKHIELHVGRSLSHHPEEEPSGTGGDHATRSTTNVFPGALGEKKRKRAQEEHYVALDRAKRGRGGDKLTGPPFSPFPVVADGSSGVSSVVSTNSYGAICFPISTWAYS